MKKLLTEEQEINEQIFYNNLDKLYLSPSSLKIFLESPKKYYNYYALNEKEEKSGKHFDEGTLVHCMVLQPEELKSKFINIGIKVPSDSTKDCINHIIKTTPENELTSNLEQYSEKIINYLKEINLHQSLASDKKAPFLTGDEKRINKIVNEDTKEYFKILIESKDKKIVDDNMWVKCLEKTEAILKNSDAYYLLKETDDTDSLAYELEMEEKDSDLYYGLKGILDVIKVSRTNKTIYVSDVKTTNSNLKEFIKSFDKYDYWLQAIIYKKLCNFFIRGKALDYKIVVNFIVVDCNNDVYCFKVSDETLAEYEIKLINLINEQFHYHIDKKEFSLPYEFANKLVYL